MKKQLSLNIYQGKHGGRRPNSGRSRIHSRGVAHRCRENISSRNPLHINFKYKAYIRTDSMLSILSIAIQNASRFEFQVTHYTIQSNHIHIIAETKDTKTLVMGMRSITNTIVKRLGKGSIQIERYHLHVLKGPLETRNAVAYVLLNDLKHRGRCERKYTQTVAPAKTWLLTCALKDIASAT